MPSVSITESSQAWSGFLPAMSIGRVMFSSAVRVGTRLNDWNTKPIRSRRSWVIFLSDSVVSSTSPIRTEPEVTLSRPARQCIRVDLPEPDGPMIAVNWPRTQPHADPGERVDGRVARPVGLDDVDGLGGDGRADRGRGGLDRRRW